MTKKKRVRLTALLILTLMLCGGMASAAEDSDAPYTVEARDFERDGQRLWGRLYLPKDAPSPVPLALLSHGLGSDHRIMEPYAERFAAGGVAAYVFDYIGGSEESMSDGTMTEMSVLTEAADLNLILDAFLADSRFGRDGVFLFGGSQGGFISAYVAGNRPGDVAGLIALYPAFNLQDICRDLARDGIPDAVTLGTHTVGRRYVEDMLTFDIYDVLARYTGPALLFHGTADPYVPEDYSLRAADALPDARLEIVQDAGHGFQGDDLERVADEALRFIEMTLSGALDADRAA